MDSQSAAFSVGTVVHIVNRCCFHNNNSYSVNAEEEEEDDDGTQSGILTTVT